MMPSPWPNWPPNRQSDLDIWLCEECGSKFGLLADFNEPTYCPNCSSKNLRLAEIPDRPRRPDDPDGPPIYLL